MDLAVQGLITQLSAIVARTSSAAIAERIQVSRAKKQDAETINELSDIINELITDRTELTTIAQGLRDSLIANQISDSEIYYIVNKVIPLAQKLISEGTTADVQAAQQTLDIVQSLISVETLTILQLIGFNYKEALGIPLTNRVASLLTPQDPSAST